MKAVALLLAGGSGERLGAGMPKALAPLAGKPMLAWSLEALAATTTIEQIVVALPVRLLGEQARMPLADVSLLQGIEVPPGTIAVAGGAVRSESVKRALAVAPPSELVLVHDAARPLLQPALAEQVLDALSDQSFAAAIAAAPVTDTIKRAQSAPAPRSKPGTVAGASNGDPSPDLCAVLETLDRSQLWSVQTPQAFRRAALSDALECSPELLGRASDDAWLIEQTGGSVAIVPASAQNIKVTTRVDFELAQLLLQNRSAAPHQGACSCGSAGCRI